MLRSFITVIGLFCIWVLLSGMFDALHLGLGAAVCILVMLAMPRTRGGPFPMFRFLMYLPWLLWQIWLSNVRVAMIVMRGTFKKRLNVQPQIVRKRFRWDDPRAQTLAAVSITLTPGTLTIDIGDEVIVHALDDSLAADVESETLQMRAAAVFANSAGPTGDAAGTSGRGGSGGGGAA